MSTTYEGQIVRHLFGWRIRLYLGHTLHTGRRIRTWRTDLGTRGVYLVPWGDRVIGAQARRVDVAETVDTVAARRHCKPPTHPLQSP